MDPIRRDRQIGLHAHPSDIQHRRVQSDVNREILSAHVVGRYLLQALP
jgi:hypothetical protein